MRRIVVIAIVAGLLTPGLTSCAGRTAATARPTVKASPGGGAAEIYAQVLRRYLGTPDENSFPGQTFTTVYVLDQAYPGAGDPSGRLERGTPIGPDTQQQIVADLAPVAHVAFIADRSTVIETRNGCAQVKDGGILITLGPAGGDDHEMRVAVNGFVACLGATWLTYVVRSQPGGGWQVTGTTGSRAIA